MSLAVAFMGSGRGMTQTQKDTLKKLLEGMGPDTFFHEDMVGACAQAHTIALLELNIPVILFPPKNPDMRAFCFGAITTMKTEDAPLRYRNMIDSAHSLIVATDGYKEVLRSSAWAGIRYARRTGKNSYVIYPDGRIRIDD